MLHVGLDLSRKRVDVCLISSEGGPLTAPTTLGVLWAAIPAEAGRPLPTRRVGERSPLVSLPDRRASRPLRR